MLVGEALAKGKPLEQATPEAKQRVEAVELTARIVAWAEARGVSAPLFGTLARSVLAGPHVRRARPRTDERLSAARSSAACGRARGESPCRGVEAFEEDAFVVRRNLRVLGAAATVVILGAAVAGSVGFVALGLWVAWVGLGALAYGWARSPGAVPETVRVRGDARGLLLNGVTALAGLHDHRRLGATAPACVADRARPRARRPPRSTRRPRRRRRARAAAGARARRVSRIRPLLGDGAPAGGAADVRPRRLAPRLDDRRRPRRRPCRSPRVRRGARGAHRPLRGRRRPDASRRGRRRRAAPLAGYGALRPVVERHGRRVVRRRRDALARPRARRRRVAYAADARGAPALSPGARRDGRAHGRRVS